MKQDTQAKFAAILAAAQQKEAAKSNVKFTQPVQAPQPEPIKPGNVVTYKNAVIPATVQTVDNSAAIPSAEIIFQDGKKEAAYLEDLQTVPAKLVSFTIIWQEGSGKNDGKIFTTWDAANTVMRSIYREHDGIGYLKVKICVKWNNGKEFTDRVDCSNKGSDFSPSENTIGEYLRKCKGAMYTSNLQEGDRLTLSFQDNPEPLTPAEETAINTTIAEIFAQSPAASQQPANPLKIVDYSDRSFAVIGETKPIKQILSSLGGKFNYGLKCGPGWIFPKTRMETVKKELGI